MRLNSYFQAVYATDVPQTERLNRYAKHCVYYMRENQEMHQLFIPFINYVW
jgi:hypothetical protein